MKYTCPHCGRKFPKWYWGITGKFGGYGTVKKPGLAAANFRRHKEACARRRESEAAEETRDCTEEENSGN